MALERLRPEHFMTDVLKPAVQNIIRAKAQKISYSERYQDDFNEYRHVILPQELSKLLPKTTSGYLMAEREWRALGVQQSLGWEHYMIHRPEPHVLLFRRPIGYQPNPATIQMHAPQSMSGTVAAHQQA